MRKLGGAGFADVWKRGAFAWEYKRPGGDLDATYVLLRGHAADLANPPPLACCDLPRSRRTLNIKAICAKYGIASRLAASA